MLVQMEVVVDTSWERMGPSPSSTISSAIPYKIRKTTSTTLLITNEFRSFKHLIVYDDAFYA
jgi:hypothetical protein